MVERRSIGCGLRRGQIDAKPVPPVVPEADRVKGPGVGHPPLAGQVAAVQAVQQMPDPIRIGSVTICREIARNRIGNAESPRGAAQEPGELLGFENRTIEPEDLIAADHLRHQRTGRRQILH